LYSCTSKACKMGVPAHPTNPQWPKCGSIPPPAARLSQPPALLLRQSLGLLYQEREKRK
jgi:hypothetical protein